jgi:hypothetical protein
VISDDIASGRRDENRMMIAHESLVTNLMRSPTTAEVARQGISAGLERQ